MECFLPDASRPLMPVFLSLTAFDGSVVLRARRNCGGGGSAENVKRVMFAGLGLQFSIDLIVRTALRRHPTGDHVMQGALFLLRFTAAMRAGHFAFLAGGALVKLLFHEIDSSNTTAGTNDGPVTCLI
jgi:hypothetical protein